MSPRARGLAVVLLPALLAWGCAVNPLTGRPEVVLVSTEEERAVGEQAAREVAEQIGLVDDALGAYLQAVGARVARHSPRRDVDYGFAIVDQPEPNAFALPGGYVYVSRGLLALTNSEDELANVLAHEVVHVAGRHHAQRQARAAGVGILTLPGRLVGAAVGGPLGALLDAPFAVLGGGLVASYSRDQERDADRVGQRMAAEAGYDPGAMPRFLETLENCVAREGSERRRAGFFESHPTTPERVASAAERAETLAWSARSGVAADRAAYLARLDGLVLGENPAAGVFREGRFLHADLDLSVRFPEGWETRNTRRAVAAAPPTGDARLVLQRQGAGDDPERAARAFLDWLAERARVDLVEQGSDRIGALPAHRARVAVASREGPISLDLTWIAHRGSVYRLTGAAPAAVRNAYRDAFLEATRSFRSLQAFEREAIRGTRLALARAEAGESLERLGERTGNAWDPGLTAAANALAPGVRLSAGQRVKIALRFRYEGGAIDLPSASR